MDATSNAGGNGLPMLAGLLAAIVLWALALAIAF